MSDKSQGVHPAMIIAVGTILLVVLAIVLPPKLSPASKDLSQAVRNYVHLECNAGGNEGQLVSYANETVMDALIEQAQAMYRGSVCHLWLGNWANEARREVCSDPSYNQDGFVLLERGSLVETCKWYAYVYVQGRQVNLFLIRQ